MNKRKKKYAIRVFCALALLFSMVITVSAASTTLDVKRVKQAKSQWCWAAVGEMIGTYMNSSSSRTQWDIVAYIKGSKYPDDPGSDNEIIKGIKYASMNTVTYTSGSTLSWDEHVTNIESGYPIGVKMDWNSNGAHALVCAGTKTIGQSNYLYIIDPWEDYSSELYKYTELKNGTTIHSGTGKYITSFWKD